MFHYLMQCRKPSVRGNDVFIEGAYKASIKKYVPELVSRGFKVVKVHKK